MKKTPAFAKTCQDILLALLVTPCARLLRLVRSQGLLSLPRCARALDKAGVLPVREHYYEPYLRPEDLRRDLDAPRDLPGLELRVEAQLELVRSFTHQAELAAIPMQPGPLRYGYRNHTFGPVDAGLLYGMIRHLRPRRIVEAGCGMSTLVIREALKAVRQGNTANAGTCEHVCIEPYEHPWLDQLPVRMIREPLERMNPAQLAESLHSNDLLFIDSSHVVKPQGDVLFVFQELLPRLKPGVVVHFHDVFTPRDYPASWLLGARVLWTEQYLLESFLCANPEWEVLLAANLLAKDHHQVLAQALPLLREYPQGLLPGLPPVFPNSLYIRKCEPPCGSADALGHALDHLDHALDHEPGAGPVARHVAGHVAGHLTEPFAELVRQLEGHEGLRLTPYRCTAGKLTIGYGRNLEDNGIRVEEARRMLREDALQALRQVQSALPWTENLVAARRGVLAAMTFNMGINALLGFTRMLARLESGDYQAAAREMLDSRWHEQVGTRAQALAEQMRTGRWS